MIAISLIGLGVILTGTVAWYLFKESRKTEQLLKENQRLKTEKQVQAVEIQQKTAEVGYANVAKKHHQRVHASTNDNVDQQLHEFGWFRDEDTDNRNGVCGVQSNLPEQGGYCGNETANFSSQSEL